MSTALLCRVLLGVALKEGMSQKSSGALPHRPAPSRQPALPAVAEAGAQPGSRGPEDDDDRLSNASSLASSNSDGSLPGVEVLGR